MAIINHIQKTLTNIESIGLKSKFDLANGHASHELSFQQVNIINKLPYIWNEGLRLKSHDAELIFIHAFQQLANTSSIKNYDSFKICPTASNSIDIAAAWLAENKLKTALIEPTFDNLYLILKRRRVHLTPLSEDILYNDENWKEVLRNVDAVFIVNPNNPTGRILTYHLLKNIIEWCANHNKVIILDHSFRFFIPQICDVYQLLLESKVTFISIEDTGKVWPTQEIKTSLLFCSRNIFEQINEIYDEIFLCHSNFALLLLTEFLRDAYEQNLYNVIWKKVNERRQLFRQTIENTILSIHQNSLSSMLSVEWLKIQVNYANDIQIVKFFSDQNLIFLPGRQFFWSNGINSNFHCVRISLLKPEHIFLHAIQLLSDKLNLLNEQKAF